MPRPDSTTATFLQPGAGISFEVASEQQRNEEEGGPSSSPLLPRIRPCLGSASLVFKFRTVRNPAGKSNADVTRTKAPSSSSIYADSIKCPSRGPQWWPPEHPLLDSRFRDARSCPIFLALLSSRERFTIGSTPPFCSLRVETRNSKDGEQVREFIEKFSFFFFTTCFVARYRVRGALQGKL